MIDISKIKYTATHEWASLDGKLVTVGISDHAQKEISDVVFVELPAVGRQVKAKESVMVVESVKAAFDIYSPMSGKIVKVNEELKQHPEIVNQSPHEKGWLYVLECSDAKEFDSLLSQDQTH